MAMTKTAKLKRARDIRARVSRFVDLQDRDVAAAVQERHGIDPEYSAMNQLLLAKTRLDSLIRDLQAEGYGTEAGT